MAKSKKIILIIVEGTTDEDTFDSIIKKLLSTKDKEQFVVIRGDVTVKAEMSQLKKKIVEEIKSILSRDNINIKGDVKEIVHLVDLDGVFIKDENIKITGVSKIKYNKECIEVKDENQKKEISNRNEKKSKNLKLLLKTKELSHKKYRIYYMSCNLEVALYGEYKQLERDEKQDLADDFSDKYENDIEGFINFINSKDIAILGDYNETWEYVKQGNNSLKQGSNFHLYINSLIEK